MINTVRQRIVDAIKTAVQGAAGGRIGVVLMPEDDLGAVAGVLAGGQCAVELYLGDDDVVENERSSLEEATFEVALVIHLPAQIIATAGGAVAAAHDINGELYTLYATDGQWGGLAIKTRWIGFGGVYIDEQLGLSTVHGMRITYRFRLGSPETAA